MEDLFSRTLLIGSYEGIFFPVIEAQTRGGHSGVEHKAYKRRGADCEPTGLEPYAGTLKVALINGLKSWDSTLFPDVYGDLLDKFQTTPIGSLSHPTKGTFTAFIKSWDEHLTGKAPRNGVMLDVAFTEHNGEATILPGLGGQSTPTNTSHDTTIQAQQAETDMAAVTPSVSFLPVASVVDVQLTFLDAAARSYSEVLSSVDEMLAPVNANLALPGFAVPAAHDAVASLEALRATIYSLKDRYLGTSARPRYYVVPHTAPLWQIAFDVYKDASKSRLLGTVNNILDPVAVAAGSRLLVPPV